MKILDQLRLAQVKRYGICHVNRDQSVAEHSFMVGLIAGELALATGNEELVKDVVLYSMIHDMDEVNTGDIPSPFKKKLRRECPAVIPVLDGQKTARPEVSAIVKIADMLESIHYIREFGGSRFAEEDVLDDVTHNLMTYLARTDIDPRVKEAAKWLEKAL